MMIPRLKNVVLSASAFFLFAVAAVAQVSTMEGVVKGEDGQPLKGAVVIIERTDIKATYKLTTDKKGHYGHYGLPLGVFNITVQVDGKTRDSLSGVKTSMADPSVHNFDLKKSAEDQQALAHAAATGTMTKEQERGMSAAQKKELEKQTKEREAALSKNKELNDAFAAGRAALDAKNYDLAIESFNKGIGLDATQLALYTNLADAYAGAALTKPTEADALRQKGADAWKKVIEMKPDEADYYNNYALVLGRMKKIDEAEAAIVKAATLNPAGAGKYYFNLGAMLINSGQTEPAGVAFKKAIEADPTYASAQYQYGMYLVNKATVAPDGKIVPAPGTIEAFQKFLELQPTGPDADSAKGILAQMGSSVTTKYVNPDAKTPPAKKKK